MNYKICFFNLIIFLKSLIYFYMSYYNFDLIKTEMHKNQRDQSRSPENQGQGTIKSQKNINISAAFHMKT